MSTDSKNKLMPARGLVSNGDGTSSGHDSPWCYRRGMSAGAATATLPEVKWPSSRVALCRGS